MSGHRHHHGASHHLDFDSPEMAEFAEEEGEVLVGLVEQAISVLAGCCRARGLDVRRVVDLGCGPGVGTCLLAQRFESASVVAADGSATMLEHARTRAERLGLAHRVETRHVELPVGIGELHRADVVWASMVIHHVGDEVAALRDVHPLLEPGGLLAVVERGDPMRFLPDGADLGRPGLWERLDAAWSEWFTEMRAELPEATLSADYPVMLGDAGFELVADEVLSFVLEPPLDVQARRFVRQRLVRTRAQLVGHADTVDLEALDVLIDEDAGDGIIRRDDATLRASRRLYVAGVA